MKKIGIIGSGVVAQALGTGLMNHGYDVMLGTRDKTKLAGWKESVKNGKTGSFEDTAAFADIIILAVKGTVVIQALELAGKQNIRGKTIIDATNPISDAPPVNGVLQFFTSVNKSLMENLQHSFPEANFVKAFNSIGYALMIDPSFEIKPTMFICGNSSVAKKEVSDLLNEVGWESADFGMVESARAIESLCILWCIPGFSNNEWSHAFKLLKN